MVGKDRAPIVPETVNPPDFSFSVLHPASRELISEKARVYFVPEPMISATYGIPAPFSNDTWA